MSTHFDLDAYLARIGATRSSALAEIHRAHLGAIPFENLDPHRGVPIALDLVSLQAKLVSGRRGGYCFEQNLLLAAALEALGYPVTRHLARVRWNAAPGAALSRTHLVLAVQDGAARWLADVGFGPGSLLEPIPFGAAGPLEQSGWQLRTVAEDGLLVVATLMGEAWRDIYEIDPVPVPLIDLMTSNWYVCTHPDSRFVAGLTVGRVLPDGSHLTLRGEGLDDLELVSRTPTASQRTDIPRTQVPELLASRFGLPGFRLGVDGRIQPSVAV